MVSTIIFGIVVVFGFLAVGDGVRVYRNHQAEKQVQKYFDTGVWRD